MKRQNTFTSLKVPDDRKIVDLWIAPYGSAAVTAAIEIGITESLQRAAQTPAQLGKSLHLNPESVESVLRVLVAMGFGKERNGLFSLTEVARAYLVPSSPLSRAFELSFHFATKEHTWVVNKLRETSRVARTYGQIWRENPEENDQVKNAAAGMDSIIKAPATAIVRSGAFRSVQHILDVGGGSGAFAVTLTEHLPKVNVTVLDLPAMCKQAESWVQSRKATHIHFHPADFFKDPWAQNCDAIFFSNVLHDWPEADVLTLLKHARSNVIHGNRRPGQLYVLEVLRDKNKNGPLMATIFHLQMQMSFGGAQYTRADYVRLFKKARFSEPRIVAKFGYYSLLKAHAL